jgi:hypothetical protein
MEVEIEKGKFAEGDETMGNFDLEEQLKDLMISHDDTSDKSMDTWKTVEIRVNPRHWKKLSRAFRGETKLCALIYNAGVSSKILQKTSPMKEQ